MLFTQIPHSCIILVMCVSMFLWASDSLSLSVCVCELYLTVNLEVPNYLWLLICLPLLAICGQGQGCLNGGRCIEPGRCACLFGYTGDMCEAGNIYVLVYSIYGLFI